MISEILHRVASGQVPARFGRGINDYIFIENCVTAHMDCMNALLSSRKPHVLEQSMGGHFALRLCLCVSVCDHVCMCVSVCVLLPHTHTHTLSLSLSRPLSRPLDLSLDLSRPLDLPRSFSLTAFSSPCSPPLDAAAASPSTVCGHAFFINDFQAPMWDHMEPFLTEAGLSAPALSAPFSLVYLLAVITEALCRLLHCVTRITLYPNLTRYVIGAVAQDFYFDATKGEIVEGRGR